MTSSAGGIKIETGENGKHFERIPLFPAAAGNGIRKEHLISGMKKNDQSVIPIYGAGLVWLLRAVTGKLSGTGSIIWCAILSLAAYLILKAVCPAKKEGSKQPDKPSSTPDGVVIDLEPVEVEPKKEAKTEEPGRSHKSTGNAEVDEILKQGDESLKKIVELNEAIPDFKVSAQIRQIEILTDRIFSHVEEHPEDVRRIRQFLNYYLPTTIRLLEQYRTLQDQGMRMGNIEQGMSNIEQMLDKVALAFQKLLDSLFESTVVDITADIRVMENMMASEGLTE